MRGDLFSAYELLRQRFSPAVQRVASGLFLVTRTVADGLRIFLTALLLQYVGWGVEPAILVVGVVTIVYTYLGGMKAVIWTDLVQFLIKIAGVVLAGVFVLRLLPGGWDAFVAEGDAAGKFHLIELGVRPGERVQPVGRGDRRGRLLDGQPRGRPAHGPALSVRQVAAATPGSPWS